MPTYKVQAYPVSGPDRSLIVSASSSQEAYDKVRAWGFVPGRMVKEWALMSFLARPFRQLRQEDLILILRQLAYALESGFSLSECLRTMDFQGRSAAASRLIHDLQWGLDRGLSFSQALAETRVSLPEEVEAWARIGEQEGRLDQAFFELARLLEAKGQMRQKVRQSLAYPIFVLMMTLVVSLFLLFFVLPILAESYLELTGSLPWYMAMLLGGRQVLAILFLGLGGLIALYGLEGKGVLPARLAPWFQRLAREVPVFKEIRAWTYYVSFGRSFASLLEAGVPLAQAMDLLQSQAGPKVYLKDLAQARVRLAQGQSIPRALEACRFVPGPARSLVVLGDQTGQLPKALALSARMTEDRLKGRLETMVKLIEPLSVLVLGGVVLFVALAFFLPLLNSYDLYMG